MHWTGGAWRVPLATRMAEVRATDGTRLGRIVCADAADIDRALAGLAPGPAPDARDLHAALAPSAPLLARLRRLEGAAADGPAGAAPTAGALLVTDAATPLPAILARLAALARAGGVWVPAPQTSASAHLMMRALHPLLGRRVALLHGDAGTRATLAARQSPPQDSPPRVSPATARSRR